MKFLVKLVVGLAAVAGTCYWMFKQMVKPAEALYERIKEEENERKGANR